MTSEESLARVRGQLGMVIQKNRVIERELSKLKSTRFLYPLMKILIRFSKKLRIKL